MNDRDIALCDGEKRPSKLKFDGVASGIDQPELPGAVDFKLPCEDGPSRFFVGRTKDCLPVRYSG